MIIKMKHRTNFLITNSEVNKLKIRLVSQKIPSLLVTTYQHTRAAKNTSRETTFVPKD